MSDSGDCDCEGCDCDCDCDCSCCDCNDYYFNCGNFCCDIWSHICANGLCSCCCDSISKLIVTFLYHWKVSSTCNPKKVFFKKCVCGSASGAATAKRWAHCCTEAIQENNAVSAAQPLIVPQPVIDRPEPMAVPRSAIVTQPTRKGPSAGFQQTNGPAPSAPKEKKRQPGNGDTIPVDQLPPSYEEAVASAPKPPQP